jgi:predicted AlkP superfamily phosphohydrolase/phosphomutase
MAKTLLLGLDGATFTVLDPLMRDGHMPFLQQLVARGAHAHLLSTVHCLTPPAWTSIATGRTPGHHGIFDFVYGRQTADGFYFTLNMSYDIRCPSLWSLVSRRGLRVASLNFPVSYPPEPVNGVCIPGFVHWRHLRQSVYPPAFYDVLLNVPGFDPKLLAMDMNQELQSIQHLKPEEYEPWIVYHTKREEQWFKVVEAVMQKESPDLTAIVFDGVDKLQHLCWRLIDPAFSPKAPTAWETHARELCLSYFRQLDSLLCKIVTLAGPEARTFVVSDHGFGPTETIFYTNAWLAKQGYLRWATGQQTTAGARIASEPIKSHVEGIDWSHTVAYALTPSSNGIYIRQAASPESPGIQPSDYPGFRHRLAEELLSVADPATGKPFFRRVLTREEAFPGEAAARAPDLTLIMQDYGLQSVLNSDIIFRMRPEPWGTHYPEGIFIASGPGMAPMGRMPHMQIVDVAPTLLRSLGVEPEAAMEGRCPGGLFEFPAVAAFPQSADGSVTNAVPSPPGEPLASGDEIQAEVLRLLVQLDYFQEH